MNILVFDIGGTHMRVGFSTGHGLRRHVIAKTPRTWLKAQLLLQTLSQQISGGKKIHRVVGGLPGVLDARHTKLIAIPARPEWKNKPIQKDLQKIFGVHVHLENDASLGALGEAGSGVGRGHRIVAYIAVGTGVGGARVVNQKLQPVHLGFEPGHHYLSGRKTWTQLIGGSHLRRRFRRPGEKFTVSQWRWITEQVAIGLINVITFWSPDIIVLSGSVIIKGKMSMPLLRRRVKQLLLVVPTPPLIQKGKLGSLAGLYGALRLAKNKG